MDTITQKLADALRNVINVYETDTEDMSQEEIEWRIEQDMERARIALAEYDEASHA